MSKKLVMVSIRKFPIIVLVLNRVEYWTNYSIRFKISNICTALQSAMSGSWFTYPRGSGGMDGRVDLHGQLYTEMVYLSTVIHPSSNHLTATRRGVKLITAWS